MKTLIILSSLFMMMNTYADNAVVYGKRCDLSLSIRDFDEGDKEDAVKAIKAKGYKVVMNEDKWGATEFILHFGNQKYGWNDHVQAYFLRALDDKGQITRDDPGFTNGEMRFEETGDASDLLEQGVSLVKKCVKK